MNFDFRLLTQTDAPIVWQMLRHASHEPTLESVQSQPYLARYAAGWGRAGDGGFVALMQGQPSGAAWLRLWPGADKGFGYVNDATPELAMAVVPEWRGQGIGTRLLAFVLQAAQSAHPAVSLNVRADNLAVRLYERMGFVRIENSEVVNRTGGISFNMIYRFGR